MPFSDESCNRRVTGIHNLSYKTGGIDEDTNLFNDLGKTDPEGIILNIEDNFTPMTGDLLGKDTTVDGFFSGRRVTLEFVLQEPNRSLINEFLYPWATYDSASQTTAVIHKAESGPIIGQLISEIAGLLRATPEENSPAAGLYQYLEFRGIATPAPYTVRLGAHLQTYAVLFQVIPSFERTRTVYWDAAAPV